MLPKVVAAFEVYAGAGHGRAPGRRLVVVLAELSRTRWRRWRRRSRWPRRSGALNASYTLAGHEFTARPASLLFKGVGVTVEEIRCADRAMAKP
jgi:hypothetical protein